MHRTGNAATRSIAGSPSFSETSSFLLTKVPAALGAFFLEPTFLKISCSRGGHALVDFAQAEREAARSPSEARHSASRDE